MNEKHSILSARPTEALKYTTSAAGDTRRTLIGMAACGVGSNDVRTDMRECQRKFVMLMATGMTSGRSIGTLSSATRLVGASITDSVRVLECSDAVHISGKSSPPEVVETSA